MCWIIFCIVSDIQDYLEYIFKKHDTVTGNPPIRIYINKIEDRTTFKIKIGYYLELLTPETIKRLGSTKSNMTKTKMLKMCFDQKLLKQY